jgi:alkylation response protein AidB-like acyl-CoA dehydrogenase
MSGLFTDEHELFRKSVRTFVEQEVGPHVDAWEKAEEIPRAIFRRMGALGFLGVQFPVEFGGAGADFATSMVLAEDLARSRSGGFAFSVIVHTDMSSPRLKVRVLLRAALTLPWSPEDWPEIRQHLKWLLAEESRLRRQGWLN